MAAPRIDLSGEKVRQKINFVDLFGVSLKSRRDLKLSIAQDLIDLMVSRVVDDNTDVDGNALKGYSSSYQKSQAFAEYGKAKGDVNMQLTGDMMASIDVVEEGDDYITLGLQGDLNNSKAHGHMKGANYLPVRRFFGVSTADIENIKGAYADDFESLKAESPTTAADIMKALDLLNSDQGTSAAQSALGDLIGF